MEIVKAAAKTLFDDNINDLSLDYLEIGIDNIIENDMLKELPIVKTIHAVAKVSIAIKEKFFLKKFLTFINDFNFGCVNEKEIAKRKTAIENNEQWIQQEIEYLVIYIDNVDSIEKSRILAILYCNFLDRKIEWERFAQYTEILNRMFVYDIKMLKGFYCYSLQVAPAKNKSLFYDLTSYNRLIGLGLMVRNDFVELEEPKVYRLTYSGIFLGRIISEMT